MPKSKTMKVPVKNRSYWERKAKEAERILLTPEKMAAFSAQSRNRLWPEILRIQRALAVSYARAKITPVCR